MIRGEIRNSVDNHLPLDRWIRWRYLRPAHPGLLRGLRARLLGLLAARARARAAPSNGGGGAP